MKAIVKLAIVALLANACWRLGSAYLTFYRFKDAVEQSAQFSHGRSEGELQERIMELASQYDVPLAADAVTVRRDGNHTITAGEYSEPIDFAPGFTRPWTFTWETDTFVSVPARLDPSDVK